MSTDGGSNPRPPSRWDRPPPPHDWRWVVGNIGKVLIATGLLMFGFVAYQLWGTGIEYAQAQDDLDAEFEELLATHATTVTVAPPTTPRSDPPVAAASPVTTLPPTTTALAPPPAVQPVRFEDGDAVARLEIPSIGLDSTVVQGVASADLKRGPGHYPDTPLPGQLGNSAIAGHRTTYGEPFADLDRVAAGDEIIVTTVEGRFVYRMTSSEIVAPSASEVVATTDPSVARLTLTTCHPRWTARQRLIVFADLDLEASAAPQEPVIPDAVVPPAPDATLPGDPATTALPIVEQAPTSSPATTVPATTTVPPAADEEETTTTSAQRPPMPSTRGGSTTTARSPRWPCGGPC